MKASKWKIIVILLVIAAVSVLAIQYNNNRGSSADGGPMRYKELLVTRGLFKIVVSASGVVKPIDRIEIKSKASGRIVHLPVEEGDFVKKGELICRLDQTDVQADLDQAQADLDIAEAELKQAQNTFGRRSKLFKKGLISQEEFDDTDLAVARAKGKLVRARISLSQAQVRLSETIVRSPIDGIVLKKLVEAGQIISSGISNISGGTPIAAVADMRSVYIEAGIDEIDVGKIEMGQDAIVIAEAYPQKEFTGKIIRIAPEAKIEQNVTLFDVIVEVTNEDAKLKSGMNASVEITIVEQVDVILAPSMALTLPEEPGDNKYMRQTLLKRDGRFVFHELEIGLSDFRQAIVLAGLKEGDTLGVPMTSRLKEDNDRLEQRIKNSRSFGGSSSSSSKKSGGK